MKAYLPGSPIRIDDFPKLQALAEEDDAEEVAGRPRKATKREDGGWLATQVAYEMVLKSVDSELRQVPKNGDFVFVEFARPDIVRSIEDNFSKAVLDRSFLIYVYCPLSICIARNQRRTRGAHTSVDQHEVPLDRWTERYREDDHDHLDRLGVPYIIIDNHLKGSVHLRLECEKIVRALGLTI
jgi:hypothetical protein